MAVLPFASMISDANDDYSADELTDELITQTSKIPILRVISRTSVLQYRGASKPLRDVAQDLGVRTFRTRSLSFASLYGRPSHASATRPGPILTTRPFRSSRP